VGIGAGGPEVIGAFNPFRPSSAVLLDYLRQRIYARKEAGENV
jgi:hypothetical protein